MKHQQQYRTVVLLTCIIAVLVSAMSASAVAREVYSWTDENGVMHYSDTPPDRQEAQEFEVRETYLPDSGEANHAPGDTPPDAASDAVIKDDASGQETDPPQSMAEARREKIARDRIEHREAQAEMDRRCAMQRERLARIEPSRRVFYTDDSGKTVRMDDDQRLAQVQDSKDFIAKNCH